MALKNFSKYYGTENDNPITLLARRMQLPVLFGIGTGMAIQMSKGVFESPVTFGRIAQVSLPLCGMTFYYLTGTYITERIRGRDGPFNNLIGALFTAPLLRRYLSLTSTSCFLYFISLPLYALMHGIKVSKYPLSLDQSVNYGLNMDSYSINLMLQKKPSVPFIERESYNIFKVPSK